MYLQRLITLNVKLKSSVQLGKHNNNFSNQHYFSPASSETEDIIKLFDAGMCVARFNMSHGT